METPEKVNTVHKSHQKWRVTYRGKTATNIWNEENEKYEYLEIDYTAKGVVFLCTDKHKEVINSYAENGYRYVGFIPTEIDAKGCMRKIDLIFEKED